MFDRSKRNRRIELLQVVSAKFDAIANSSGILFESTHEPITEEEIVILQKQMRSSLLFLNTFPPSFIILFLVVTFFNPEETKLFEAFLTILVFSAVLFAFNWLLRKNFNEAINAQTKRVLKGVITHKLKSDSTYYFQLSKQENIKVSKKEYNNYNLGDVVQINIYHAKEIFIKKKITKLANLLDQ